MMYGYGLGYLVMFVGAVVAILLLIGLVVLVVWAVRRSGSGAGGTLGGSMGGSATAQTPKEILQMRYARGEITREQYQQMMQDLNG